MMGQKTVGRLELSSSGVCSGLWLALLTLDYHEGVGFLSGSLHVQPNNCCRSRCGRLFQVFAHIQDKRRRSIVFQTLLHMLA